jgi:glycosidase
MVVTDRFADGDPSNNGEVDPGDIDRRHGGDLLGIVERMPYLRELGVTALWITPVYVNPTDSYHGYHPLDFEKVDPRLCSPELGPAGSIEVVRRFVEIAHEHGLKVVLDIVVNHTAPGHPWLEERPEWYNVNGPSVEKWWVWGLPDLNHDLVDVNVYFVRNVLEWVLSTGADGIRFDAVRHVEKQFWQTFKVFAKNRCPWLTLIGEVWDADPGVITPYQTQYGFDSMFDYPLYHGIIDVFTSDHSFRRIARTELWDDEPYGVLNRDGEYSNAHQMVTFLDNHDTARFFHLAGGPERRREAILRTKLALTFLFTTRGIPQLYYGSELGLEGGIHPDNRRDMPWHLVDDPLDFSPEAQTAAELHGFTQRLIQLRKSSLALRYGFVVTLYVTPTLYAFARVYPGDTRIVVLNNAWEPADVSIPLHANPRLPHIARQHLRNGLHMRDDLNPTSEIRVEEGNIRVRIPGKTAAVYRGVIMPEPGAPESGKAWTEAGMATLIPGP